MEKIGEFYIGKMSSNKAHIYYLPLNNNDYVKVEAKGDGTYSESVSSVLRVSLNYINDLKPADLPTALCLEKIKNILK